jgi:hypothetical protein
MKKRFHAVIPVILGLVAAQVIATFHVYLSNASLYRTTVLIRDAGYLAVPNAHIMPSLKEWGPAFFGGLFFTLTVGVGLAILSFSAAWSWHRLFRKRKSFLILLLVLWAACLVSVNLQGVIPVASLYFLVIPPLVFWTGEKWLAKNKRKQNGWTGLLHVLPILALAFLWGSQADKRLFLDLRDYLLLSNPVGARVNNFYYDYTLYPAEVFKSLRQKLLKTAVLENIPKEPVSRAFQRELLHNDYLTLEPGLAADLRVRQSHDQFLLVHNSRTILRTSLKDFVSNSASVLGQFSLKCDRYALFRAYTFYALLIAFPIFLYLFLHAILCAPLSLLLSWRVSMVISSLLCLFIGVALWAFFHHQSALPVGEGEMVQALKSDAWQVRVAALKIIERKHMEITEFPTYKTLLSSPHVPERYWLTRALGASRQPETFTDLLRFLEDPHPNVVSMAFYALGRRGDRRAIPEIVKRIEDSHNWYNQWHAYKALRMLGWTQSRSEQGSFS